MASTRPARHQAKLRVPSQSSPGRTFARCAYVTIALRSTTFTPFPPRARPRYLRIPAKRGHRHRRIGRLRAQGEDSENCANRRQPQGALRLFHRGTLEAGISLMGWRSRHARGKAQIPRPNVYLKDGEAFLFGAHLNALTWPPACHTIPRARAAAVHTPPARSPVARSSAALYPGAARTVLEGGRAKLEVGLAKGKKQHDKRANEKDRTGSATRAIMKSAGANVNSGVNLEAGSSAYTGNLGRRFRHGLETAGAYRGAGSSLNYLQTYSCQSDNYALAA